MTPLTLARFAALLIAYFALVHTAVWGMSAMMADMGDGPVLNWSAWWTREGLLASVVLQTRVGLVVGLIGFILRRSLFRSPPPGRGGVGALFTGMCMLGAVIIEIALMASGSTGVSRAEILRILGPEAHNMITIGSAVAASQWTDYHFRHQPTISAPEHLST
jgi:hypothetical protein